MTLKRTASALAVLALAVTATGCGSSASGGSADKTLGIVTISATDSNNAKVIKGAKAAAEAEGWKVKVVDAQGSADQANSAMRTFATQKVGMIFDLVFPATSLGAGLAAARAADIPVATWGGGDRQGGRHDDR